MKPKVLVTPRSVTSAGHPALDDLREAGYDVVFSTPGRQPTEEELLELVPGCVGYLAGVEKVTARVLEAARDLKVISRNGVGIDNIDLDAAGRLNVRVCRALGANSQGVAELTVGLMFALARSIPFSDRTIKSDLWERRKGIELAGRTLGLLGCGTIGRLVARMAVALGLDVIAHDAVPDASFNPGGSFRFGSLDEVVRQSDVISLHCPPPEDGRPLIDRTTLKKTKQGVYLINTARHELVDAVALSEHLQTGHVAGAALDVFDSEPPTDGSLANNDRVIATPHIGGFTQESVGRAVQGAVDNILAALQ